jgi:hypothetical protein
VLLTLWANKIKPAAQIVHSGRPAAPRGDARSAPKLLCFGQSAHTYSLNLRGVACASPAVYSAGIQHKTNQQIDSLLAADSCAMGMSYARPPHVSGGQLIPGCLGCSAISLVDRCNWTKKASRRELLETHQCNLASGPSSKIALDAHSRNNFSWPARFYVPLVQRHSITSWIDWRKNVTTPQAPALDEPELTNLSRAEERLERDDERIADQDQWSHSYLHYSIHFYDIGQIASGKTTCPLTPHQRLLVQARSRRNWVTVEEGVTSHRIHGTQNST